jgi:hypothetical protein
MRGDIFKTSSFSKIILRGVKNYSIDIHKCASDKNNSPQKPVNTENKSYNAVLCILTNGTVSQENDTSNNTASRERAAFMLLHEDILTYS